MRGTRLKGDLRGGLLAAAAGLMALSAAGCRGEEEGRIAVPDATPAALLPEPMALPYAEPAPIAWAEPDAGYRLAERAYGLEQAFHDAPPDYAFDYQGVQPWAWESADDWAMYAEPWETGYRYYYYEPGAAYPYFVRDGLYGYGFDPAGVLTALIDADGDYLPAERFAEAAPLAGRYYLHGRDLRNAAAGARRTPVGEARWAQRAPQVRRASEPWLAAAGSDRDWRAWRAEAGGREAKRFQKEAARREREARRWRSEIARVDLPQAQGPQPGPRGEGAGVQARRDLAMAQREQLRAQRDEARREARVAARTRARETAQKQEQAQEHARAAEQHARHAAAKARMEAREERRDGREGGPRREDGGPDRSHDRGPDKGHDRGKGGERGGGKKG